MKKYIDYLNEISADELFNRLVGFGLFCEKVPPFLQSEDFLTYVSNITLPFPQVKAKDYMRYSSMRNINVPRQMAIPEPFAYVNLCYSLKDNWIKICTHFKFQTRNQKYKVSRIHLRKLKDTNALFEMNYKNFTKDGEPEDDILIKSKYLVKADISNFFPSIYSHSLSWALKTKEYSKLNTNKEYWFNVIDRNVRNTKYGETNGILIGPHTSNLLSEILLANVDNYLLAKGYKYLRNIDDFECYVDSYEKAEKFLIDLSSEIRKCELKLNDKKSEIIRLPKTNKNTWYNKLSNYVFINTYIDNGVEKIRFKELKTFLDFVIELVLTENNNSSIINYAIKIIANKSLSYNAKQYFLKKIHHLVLLYPYLIPLLDEYVFTIHNISKNTIQEIAQNVYELGIMKGIYEANSYALFWAIKHNFKLNNTSHLSDEAKISKDPIFLLIAYMYDKIDGGKSKIKEYKKIARDLKIEFDRYWLFIYEVLPYSDLKSEFKTMKKDGNISFIKHEFS